LGWKKGDAEFPKLFQEEFRLKFSTFVGVIESENFLNLSISKSMVVLSNKIFDI